MDNEQSNLHEPTYDNSCQFPFSTNPQQQNHVFERPLVQQLAPADRTAAQVQALSQGPPAFLDTIVNGLQSFVDEFSRGKRNREDTEGRLIGLAATLCAQSNHAHITSYIQPYLMQLDDVKRLGDHSADYGQRFGITRGQVAPAPLDEPTIIPSDPALPDSLRSTESATNHHLLWPTDS
ncbi:hypothetical protein PM082_015056 [Marasmius tenuissimus]|nr:hypothetical protein PM082_015056 [Marasmius tenuissimus]